MDEIRPGASEADAALRGSVAPSVRLFAPGTEIGRRYEVRGVLGTGGSAVVYEAFDRELKRRVALKVLRTDRATASAMQRFRHEVAIARDAASPRLVRVFDIGQAGDTVFLTMELVEGESLRDLLARGPLAPDRAVRIGAEVLRALADLHALGIVHRDVKPGNVLLGAAGEVKLADFGLARHWEGTVKPITETDALVGTVEYLSPEQALGDLLDARSDLYSLGVLLFEMLAGKVPLRGDSAIGTIVAHIRQTPADVRRVRPEVPAWLSGVVARLLAKDRERRYASAADVLADLEARRATRGSGRPGHALGALLAAAALVTLAAALLPFLPWNRPRFSRLVSDANHTVRALDSEGRVLWSREDAIVGGNTLLARTGPNGRREVALVAGAAADPEKSLTFLDPESGRVLRRRSIAWNPSIFAELADTYDPASINAWDLDGDGRDELAFVFTHSLLWPSVSYVFDARSDRTSLAFYSSGHMRPWAAVDLDGDGTKEVLFRGFANRMGMNGALAALRVPRLRAPAQGERLVETWVVSPDRQPVGKGQELLLWYALVPGAAVWTADAALPIPERRVIPLPLVGGGRAEWGFDGFCVRPLSSRPARARNEARNRAYAGLREAQRLRSTGTTGEALAEVEGAARAAAEASDDLLAEWVERVRGSLLASARRLDEAEGVFAGLLARATMTSSIAWEAGRAFHLAGDPARAVAWYRRGFTGAAARLQIGRHPRDLFEGIVLALGEQRRWGDALAECDREDAGYPEDALSASWFRTWVRWRTGRPTAPPPATWGELDAWKVWSLESRFALGAPPSALLSDVEALRRKASEVGPLLDSLEAELLAALGRREEAKRVALAALEGCRSGSTTSTLLRAHLDLVAERARRLGALAVRPAGEAERR